MQPTRWRRGVRIPCVCYFLSVRRDCPSVPLIAILKHPIVEEVMVLLPIRLSVFPPGSKQKKIY